MSVGLWQTPEPTAQPKLVQTLVIGAGLIGSYLALQSQADVVLDARHVAGGASGRNGGLLLTGIANSYQAACAEYGRDLAQTLWRTTIRNRELMIEWATKLGSPVRRCGSFIFAYSEQEHAELANAAALMHEDGFSTEWHAEDPTKRGFWGALHNPDDGAIQAALLTSALLRESGAQLYEASEVYALESTADGVLVRARTGNWLAQQVLVATNAWTGLLLPEFSQLVIPARGQLLATAPIEPILAQACYCDYGFTYFQQTPAGNLVLGGFRNRAVAEEQTFADCTTPLIQDLLDGFLQQHFREAANAPIERRWAGTMGFAPDHRPLVGRLRRDDRIGFAVGFSGHGLGLGLVAADELLAELAGTPAALFSARRFSETAHLFG